MIKTIFAKLEKLKEKIEYCLEHLYEPQCDRVLLASAIEAEKLCMQIRELLITCYGGKSKAEKMYDYFDRECHEMGIRIWEKDGSLFVDMPILLPFKKLKNLNLQSKPNDIHFGTAYEHCNFMIAALRWSFEQYCASHEIDKTRYRKAVLIYTNYYNNGYPKTFIPDNDNYECKQITDAVIHYISDMDDGYPHDDFYYKTETDTRAHTLLEVRPKEGFSVFEV